MPGRPFAPPGMTVQEIANFTLLSDYHIREVIRMFNAGGLSSIRPRTTGNSNPKFNDEERASIAELAMIPPRVLGYPFNAWSLSKLNEAVQDRKIVANGKEISDESIRLILEEFGVSYQRTKTWKESNDPEFEIKKSELRS
jgi:transposase